MIAIYADENVERSIVLALRRRGVDVLTAEEDGFAGQDDVLILDRAARLGRVVFSRDQDFLREAARRREAGGAFAGVIYAQKRQVSIGQCVDDLELLAKAGTAEDLGGRVYFLPL